MQLCVKVTNCETKQQKRTCLICIFNYTFLCSPSYMCRSLCSRTQHIGYEISALAQQEKIGYSFSPSVSKLAKSLKTKNDFSLFFFAAIFPDNGKLCWKSADFFRLVFSKIQKKSLADFSRLHFSSACVVCEGVSSHGSLGLCRQHA